MLQCVAVRCSSAAQKNIVYATAHRKRALHISKNIQRIIFRSVYICVAMLLAAADVTQASEQAKSREFLTKHIAYLKLPIAKAPTLRMCPRNTQTRARRDKTLADLQRESTLLIAMVRKHSSHAIKDSPLVPGLLSVLKGSQELHDTCTTDGVPLQQNDTALTIITALSKTTKVVRALFPQSPEVSSSL